MIAGRIADRRLSRLAGHVMTRTSPDRTETSAGSIREFRIYRLIMGMDYGGLMLLVSGGRTRQI